MKSEYMFTLSPTKRQQLITELLEYGARARRKLLSALEIEQAALLVLDMQRFFLDSRSHAYVPTASRLIRPIKSLIEVFVKKKSPVIFTRHTNTVANAQLMKVWWNDLLDPTSPLSYLHPEFARLVEQGSDNGFIHLLEKHQYDAFYGTDLDLLLKRYDRTRIIITGVMTHLCCETTARSAFVRGYLPYVVVDGTASYNLLFHRGSIRNLAHGIAVPISVDEIIEKTQGQALERSR